MLSRKTQHMCGANSTETFDSCPEHEVRRRWRARRRTIGCCFSRRFSALTAPPMTLSSAYTA
jgi:hypothetical protein